MNQGPRITLRSPRGAAKGMRPRSPLTVIFTLYNIPIAWWEGSLFCPRPRPIFEAPRGEEASA
jgi:hypothetical protein